MSVTQHLSKPPVAPDRLTVEEKLPLTNLVESFREEAEGIVARGDTTLFDVIEHGVGMLQAFGEKHKGAEGSEPPRLRLLVLSDGADTGSRASSVDVARLCQTEGITVDAVLIGGTDVVPTFSPK